MMGFDKILVNGNEAVAYAAMDEQVSFFSHYPGSPVTKVEQAMKKLKRENGLSMAFNDAQNEHIAALSAMGASFAQAKSMLVMKHVGLNIAADPLVYSGYSGVKGGLVVIVGTDPGANSSTGEQDVHWYAKAFNFPLYEPTSVQEIYLQVRASYQISIAFETPVFVFIPVELAHTVASIQRMNDSPIKNNFVFRKDKKRYINVGQKAVANHKILVQKISNISELGDATDSHFNGKAKIGIVTRGLAFGYVLEAILKLNLQEAVALLQVKRVFPISQKEIIDFAKDKDELIFVEDQDGFLETMVKQVCFNELNCKIFGKSHFPEYGALDRNFVLKHFADKFSKPLPQKENFVFEIEERLGTFCEGCPHTASFYAIADVLDDVDFVLGGDIGCSSLPPYKADWLLCMNAGIGISQGIAMVSDQLVISTGGDGSFFHGGMISLQSAVENNINMIHIVFDNQYIAMTGHQYSPTQGKGFQVETFLEAIGVQHFNVVNVFEKDQMKNALKEAIEVKKGVRVIWARGACALITNAKRGQEPYAFTVKIDADSCGDCRLCYEKLACPAIKMDENEMLFSDENLCVRCGVCAHICPKDAIHHVGIERRP